MKQILSSEDLRRLRAHQQHLSDASRSTSAADIVRGLCALQSQEWNSAQLALQARARGITQADVIRARETERGFVLTWSLRGTLHLVAAEDVRWQLALCGPGAIRGTKRRYEQLGLSATIREEALRAIESLLNSEGALTRPEMARAIAGHGIPVEGQAIHHLVRFAALRALICLGPQRGGDLTYALLDDWLPAAGAEASPDNPLAHFARRYLEAYAPATAADFARWSGLRKTQARTAWGAIAGEYVTVGIPGGEAQMLQPQLEELEAAPDEPLVRFLPRYDNYLLGYKSRAFMVADAHAKRVHPGGGMIRACVIIDGEAKANWKLEKRRTGARLVVEPFEAIERLAMPLLEAEAKALGAFLNTTVELHLTDA